MVIRSSRNIFTIRAGNDGEEREVECRIKGKILKAAEGYYNPLAPGDLVEVEDGLILGLEKRRNVFARFNQKGQSPQLLAANVDLVLCVTSPASPPFRPRFLDRALLQAEAAGIPSAIVCNKYDLVRAGSPAASAVEERLSDFERIGCPVFRLSAHTGEGMDEFKRFIGGKFSVLVGQSGVGKSSLVNVLIPGRKIKTGPINEKFNRGNHVTTQAVLLDLPVLDIPALDVPVLDLPALDVPVPSVPSPAGRTRIIDTPGIRRFAPTGIEGEDIIFYMPEFAPLAGTCAYGLSCSHQSEPGCKIREALAAATIHQDRYESFLRIREELSGKQSYPDYD